MSTQSAKVRFYIEWQEMKIKALSLECQAAKLKGATRSAQQKNAAVNVLKNALGDFKETFCDVQA